jgi:hypothetical protein
LQGQCLVENEAARPRKAAHAALLLAVRQDLVLIGLQPLHGSHYIFAYVPQQQDIGRFTQHFRQHAHGLRKLLRHKLWQLYIEQQETALPAEQIA